MAETPTRITPSDFFMEDDDSYQVSHYTAYADMVTTSHDWDVLSATVIDSRVDVDCMDPYGIELHYKEETGVDHDAAIDLACKMINDYLAKLEAAIGPAIA